MAFYAFFGLLNYINYFQFLFEMWDAEKNIHVPNKTDKKILQPFPDLISGHLCLYSVWKENQTCVRNKTCKGFKTVYFFFSFFLQIIIVHVVVNARGMFQNVKVTVFIFEMGKLSIFHFEMAPFMKIFFIPTCLCSLVCFPMKERYAGLIPKHFLNCHTLLHVQVYIGDKTPNIWQKEMNFN